jgi:hypothetical protein
MKTMPYPPYTYTSPDDPAREDDGLFGPGSVTWRVMSSRIMWVAVVRALYLQALHPRVIRCRYPPQIWTPSWPSSASVTVRWTGPHTMRSPVEGSSAEKTLIRAESSCLPYP